MQDVLVMMQEPVVPMCFMRVRPIGVMHMIDGGEADDKVIAVHLDDPEYKHIKDISEVPKHRLAEIRYCSCCLLLHFCCICLSCLYCKVHILVTSDCYCVLLYKETEFLGV